VPRTIVLVGLMGSGKTTVGHLLAERLGYRFLDNDAGIEAEYEATGAELAERLGVEQLHRIEAAQLARALESFGSEDVVIAAAASVVDDPASRSRLADPTVVWLDADPAYLAGRLDGEGHRRSLGIDAVTALAGQADIRREHFAAVADLVVPVEGRSAHDIVEEIRRRLDPLPPIYSDMADWFHLLTAPADYEEEADFYLARLAEAATRPIETLLELGSGGGNNASHMKRHADLTLTDLSPDMLDLSRSINPECEHIVGDMRTIRLDRCFDAVFVQDAIGYLTTEEDLRAAVRSAAVHCEPGGAVLLAPDEVVETFRASSGSGGHSDETRSLRYESKIWDPDPADTTYLMELTYHLQEAGRPDRELVEVHELGLFPRETWLRAMRDAGLTPSIVPSQHSEQDHVIDVFIGVPNEDAAR
jgi:shikimate kinase